jgi:hypothetical protein
MVPTATTRPPALRLASSQVMAELYHYGECVLVGVLPLNQAERVQPDMQGDAGQLGGPISERSSPW